MKYAKKGEKKQYSDICSINHGGISKPALRSLTTISQTITTCALCKAKVKTSGAKCFAQHKRECLWKSDVEIAKLLNSKTNDHKVFLIKMLLKNYLRSDRREKLIQIEKNGTKRILKKLGFPLNKLESIREIKGKSITTFFTPTQQEVNDFFCQKKEISEKKKL